MKIYAEECIEKYRKELKNIENIYSKISRYSYIGNIRKDNEFQISENIRNLEKY